jgi:peptide chain release factor 2
VLKEISLLKNSIELANNLEELEEEVDTFFELFNEGENVLEELSEKVEQLQQLVDKAEFEMLLSGKHDSSNAILTIHSGSGGTESQDWASMLYRMYARYIEKKGFSSQIIEYQSGDEAGIKSVTVLVSGDYAFGYLKAETGVHRLVRISPFDANQRRHTSFASVLAVPEVDDDIEIEIAEKDLRIDTYRASGAGGQHVNTTDSAVRITHLPTGVVVCCQNERSQIKNREVAMKVLKSRLYELELEKQKKAQDDLAGEKKEISWGSQIRSYVLHPYRMIKDHRTNYEVGNVDAVLDGELDGFIRAYLTMEAGKKR